MISGYYKYDILVNTEQRRSIILTQEAKFTALLGRNDNENDQF